MSGTGKDAMFVKPGATSGEARTLDPMCGMNGVNEMSFAFADQDMLVRILTDAYAYPLEAAIRETLSNALDAVSRAGVDASDGGVSVRMAVGRDGDEDECVPGAECSDIYSQGALITVSDAGDGMDFQTLLDRFLSYASSDKGDESDSIGAFGLGAKSPLAYTDEFDVYTRVAGGPCLHARPHRNESGGASVAMPIAVADTEAPIPAGAHGTVVSFRIAGGDVLRACAIVCFAAQIAEAFDGVELDAVIPVPKHRFDGVERSFLAQGRERAEETKPVYGDARLYCDFGTALPRGRSFAHAVIASGEVHGFEYEASLSFDAMPRLVSRLACFDGDDALAKNEMCYRIGCWLYPASGGAVHAPSHPAFGQGVSVDGIGAVVSLPSRALDFTPSRDQIIDGSTKCEAVFDAMRDALCSELKTEAGILRALHGYADAATCGEKRATGLQIAFTRLFGTACSPSCGSSNRYSTTRLLSKPLHDEGASEAELAVLETANQSRYSQAPLKLDELALPLCDVFLAEGVSAQDALRSPLCVSLRLSRRKDGGEYRQSNPLVSPGASLFALTGSVFRTGAEPHSLALWSAARAGFARTSSACDGAVSDRHVMPETALGGGRACQAIGAAPGEEPASAVPALLAPLAMRLVPFGKTVQASSAPVPSDSACASTSLLLIDASRIGVKSARAKLRDVAAHVIGEASGSGEAAFIDAVLVPPASDGSRFCDDRFTELAERMELVARSSGYDRFVAFADGDFASLAKRKPRKTAKKKKTDGMQTALRYAALLRLDPATARPLDDDEANIAPSTSSAKQILDAVEDWSRTALFVSADGSLRCASREFASHAQKSTDPVYEERDVARACCALGLVPDGRDAAVCLSAKHTTAKRIDAFLSAGAVLVHDGSGSFDGKALVKREALSPRPLDGEFHAWRYDKAKIAKMLAARHQRVAVSEELLTERAGRIVRRNGKFPRFEEIAGIFGYGDFVQVDTTQDERDRFLRAVTGGLVSYGCSADEATEPAECEKWRDEIYETLETSSSACDDDKAMMLEELSLHAKLWKRLLAYYGVSHATMKGYFGDRRTFGDVVKQLETISSGLCADDVFAAFELGVSVDDLLPRADAEEA